MNTQNITIQQIEEGLKESGYISNKRIAFSVFAAINNNMPLLIEGDPGAGKTSLAKATARMLNLPLLRVQFYEGLTADKILYDYDYQKQLLTIESIKSALESNLEGKSIEQAISIVENIDFYGENFLIKRPILEAISGEQQYVLLLDEVDKTDEAIEYTLLEMLEEYSLTIPQLGTITCPEDKRPIVFLTSNNYRELSDALKRRCAYLYIPKKTTEEMYEILKQNITTSEELARNVASCMAAIHELDLNQMPSIAEATTWMHYLESLGEITEENVDMSVCMIAKNNDDRIKIMDSEAMEPLKHKNKIENIFS